MTCRPENGSGCPVLLGSDGQQNTAIAARLDVHVNMVRAWRKRFFEAGLDRLADRPRPGRPRFAPSKVAEVRPMDGEPAVERGVPPAQWNSTEPAAQAVAEDLVAILGPDRAGGRRSARRSGRPGATAAVPAGQLIPFQSRDSAPTTLDALRHLVSSINRYLAEIDAEHVRDRAGAPAPTGR